MSVSRIRRIATAVVATATAIAVVGLGTVAVRAAVDPGLAGLAAVGPVSGSHGFPVWYEDRTGTRVGLCLDGTDPLCGFLPGDIPDPDLPVSFPGNFPEEAFYMLAGAGLDMDNGGAATLTLGLEAAFANAVAPGEQMVFGRVRVKVTDAQPDAYYVVFHPYGTDVVQAEPDGRLFVTEDIGITPGDFSGALSSRIGPFLSWGADAPAGYLGDPNLEHTVVGSPVTDANGAPQNYFKVVGPLADDPGATAESLVNADGPSTDLFGLQGKLATDAGVSGVAAYYTPGSGAPGSGALDVFATSDPGQAIEVAGQPAMGFGTTLMAGGTTPSTPSRYHARLPLGGVVPAAVTLVNIGDTEPASVTVPVVDAVTVTAAEYDSDSQTLHVAAVSSDSQATLTASGLGDLAGGSATFTGVDAAPGLVRVTSSGGGEDTAPPTTVGTPFDPAALLVSAGGDLSVPQGQTFTLAATVTQGDADQFLWDRVDGGTSTVGSTQSVSYTAPDAASLGGLPMTFRVTATGPGGSAYDEVDVTVTGVLDPIANAGADQIATRGTQVTVDGSGTQYAVSYAWTQVSGPAVTLTGADTSTPRFTFPRYDFATFADPAAPVVLSLTATGLGGTTPSTDTVSIAPAAGEGLVVTAGQYRRGKREWRIDGTSSVAAGQTVKVHLGTALSGPVIGTAVVDATSAWRIRLTLPQGSAAIPPNGVTSQPISVESGMGGVLQGPTAFNATVGN